MADLQDRQIDIGGQSLTLRFSVRAMLALKETWGLEDNTAVEKRMKTATMDDFITIMWAGLRTHHKEFTEEMVLGLLDDGGLGGIEEMQKAIEAATPPAPKGPPAQGQRKPRSR